MKCDACNAKEASVFLTQIIQNKMQKVNLCIACAKAKGVNDPLGFQLTEHLEGVGETKQESFFAEGSKCPVCGFTQADLKKTGRLGCSNCYGVFFDTLLEMLKKLHKGTKHLGKMPAKLRSANEENFKIRALEEDLEQAVKGEAYEQAAKIRDAIKQWLQNAAEKKES